MVAINNKRLKNNNKGFSLVDIMIAIAVLAILITPIILQVTTTINTSAKAKEKQYVVDSAASVMEYFKQTSMDDIKKNAPTVTDKNIDFKTSELIDNMDTVSFKGAECHIFVNGSDTGCVEVTDSSYVDPNSVSLGNIQDLDSDKIAIIEGEATKT